MNSDNQQDPSVNQGTVGQQQNPAANQSTTQQQQGEGLLDGVRDMAEQQIDQVIDNLATKVPGGQRYAEQAKDAASGVLDTMQKEAERRVDEVLDNVQKEAEKRVGGMVGGMFGGLLGGNQQKQGS